jgi:hypothetical protein
MKKFIFLFTFLLCQNLLCLAQQHAYFGFRGELSLIAAHTSETVDVKNAIGLGGGLAYHYPISQTWEMTADALFSFYKLNGQTAEYVDFDYKMVGMRSLKLTSFDLNYCILRGLGSKQQFKVGVGVGLGLIPNGGIYEQSPYFTNTSTSKNGYHWDKLFHTRPNYGLLFEGVYNIKDALQLSIRYKLGLANLYGDDEDTISWRQNTLATGIVYYFGGNTRGSINTNKNSPRKSKYQW